MSVCIVFHTEEFRLCIVAVFVQNLVFLGFLGCDIIIARSNFFIFLFQDKNRIAKVTIGVLNIFSVLQFKSLFFKKYIKLYITAIRLQDRIISPWYVLNTAISIEYHHNSNLHIAAIRLKSSNKHIAAIRLQYNNKHH